MTERTVVAAIIAAAIIAAAWLVKPQRYEMRTRSDNRTYMIDTARGVVWRVGETGMRKLEEYPASDE